MAKVLKVNRQQVKAARAEVTALRAAGQEPNPLVIKIAETHLPGESTITGFYRSSGQGNHRTVTTTSRSNQRTTAEL